MVEAEATVVDVAKAAVTNGAAAKRSALVRSNWAG
jgi:hypothetical protein